MKLFGIGALFLGMLFLGTPVAIELLNASSIFANIGGILWVAGVITALIKVVIWFVNESVKEIA